MSLYIPICPLPTPSNSVDSRGADPGLPGSLWVGEAISSSCACGKSRENTNVRSPRHLKIFEGYKECEYWPMLVSCSVLHKWFKPSKETFKSWMNRQNWVESPALTYGCIAKWGTLPSHDRSDSFVHVQAELEQGTAAFTSINRQRTIREGPFRVTKLMN
jgi:hypothetical protein